eukprot:scaffold2042_cov123-Cylindrotheca_fusiformis.AAC.9
MFQGMGSIENGNVARGRSQRNAEIGGGQTRPGVYKEVFVNISGDTHAFVNIESLIKETRKIKKMTSAVCISLNEISVLSGG